MRWLERLVRRRTLPALRATPQTRRQKNYLAESGYAYEYFYDGLRDVAGAREHLFTISGDRRNWFQIAVRVPDAGVQAWEAAHARPLADNERYGIAKMALFGAFDSRESPDAMRQPVIVAAAHVEDLLGRLGID